MNKNLNCKILRYAAEIHKLASLLLHCFGQKNALAVMLWKNSINFVTQNYPNMTNTIGCCGLDCEKCDARIATVNNDDTLRRETAAKWCQMNNTDVIKPEHINCLGCMTEGPKTPFCSTMCYVRKCCISKGFTTCAECDDKHSCKELSVFTSTNNDAYDRIIKDNAL
jgi:hypothetical protein